MGLKTRPSAPRYAGSGKPGVWPRIPRSSIVNRSPRSCTRSPSCPISSGEGGRSSRCATHDQARHAEESSTLGGDQRRPRSRPGAGREVEHGQAIVQHIWPYESPTTRGDPARRVPRELAAQGAVHWLGGQETASCCRRRSRPSSTKRRGGLDGPSAPLLAVRSAIHTPASSVLPPSTLSLQIEEYAEFERSHRSRHSARRRLQTCAEPLQ